jgi:predicted N-formylglutamate amidohydrolase
MPNPPDTLLFTCEHGGNRVPRVCAAAFKNAKGVLKTHRAWDPGALDLARLCARRLDAPLFFSTTTRLVVDLNRSVTHPRVFSKYTRDLPPAIRKSLLDSFYHPLRTEVTNFVAAHQPVLHISFHSFTPVLKGVRRATHIGMLFDPNQKREARLCARWRAALRKLDPGLKIHFNRPYRGTSDGHTTSLRGRFQPGRYMGIELEINQSLLHRNWSRRRSMLAESLAAALTNAQNPSGI